jgi:hypothetical protein
MHDEQDHAVVFVAPSVRWCIEPRAPSIVSGMTDSTSKLFAAIAARYVAVGCPERSGWCFDAGLVSDEHRELENHGLLQRVFGLPGGFGWRLTEAGLQQAKACA